MEEESSAKQIRAEDIQAKDIERRPFIKAGFVTATIGVAAMLAGCNLFDSDDCRADSDPTNPIRCDND